MMSAIKTPLAMGVCLVLSGFTQADVQKTHCTEALSNESRSYRIQALAGIDYSEVEGAMIDEIYITSLPVFDETDPDENSAFYRFANRLHIETKTARIKQQLLFTTGDVLDTRVINETSRLLRNENYLFDAGVRPFNHCDGRVDLEVVTRDVWSFTPEISFGRSGGENDYRLGLRDINLFGQGIELAVRTKRDTDRDSTEFVYKDQNIRGSRLDGKLTYSDNTDGTEVLAALQLPFYALDSRRSWQISLEETDRIETQYFRGDEVSEVRRDAKDYLAKYGWSEGLRDGVARRWSLGFRYSREKFSPGDELPPPAILPIDKTLSYPFVEYARVEDGYTTGRNLDQLHRTEDVHLGYDFWTRLGYALRSLGSDSDRIVMAGAYTDTLDYDRASWLSHKLTWYGLYNLDEDKAEDVNVDYELRYLRDQTKHRAFYAALRATYTHNRNTHQQLFYGGDSGATAFDNRFQTGDRRVSITLEERMYTDIHLFNIIRVGWVIFLDAGKAWEPGRDDGIEDDYLASAGFGLRLASSKSHHGGLLHIDLAFPLTNADDANVDSREISVNLRKRF